MGLYTFKKNKNRGTHREVLAAGSKTFLSELHTAKNE